MPSILASLLAVSASLVLLLVTLFVALNGGKTVLAAVMASMLVSVPFAVWRTRRRARATLAGLGVCAAAFIAAVIATAFAVRPPRQVDLVSTFRAHRTDFEALREMVAADGLFAVIGGGDEYAREPFVFRPPSALGLAPHRVAGYRQRLRAAGCERIDVFTNGAVSFAMGGWGMANRGWRVALVWTREPPSPIVPTIDGFAGGRGPSDVRWAYSAIADGWYVRIVW